jgi:hypothetical protein
MSALNPYEKYLDGRAMEVILEATPGEIETLLAGRTTEWASTPPAPGKWSAVQIVSHLADCEIVFAFRLRQTLAEDAPVIQPFDQDQWAATYSGIDAAQALSVFKVLRGWNLLLIQNALPAAANRVMTHPERGTMTFQAVVETIAGHDLNHLAQLRLIASAD